MEEIGFGDARDLADKLRDGRCDGRIDACRGGSLCPHEDVGAKLAVEPTSTVSRKLPTMTPTLTIMEMAVARAVTMMEVRASDAIRLRPAMRALRATQAF